LETFEKMRKRGRLDRSVLMQFGVVVPEAVIEENEEHLKTSDG
jgi:hypothetical protein